MADPFWTDGQGNRFPEVPCSRCASNVGPLRMRVEHLRHLGWQAYRVERFQSWCGHGQEVIPVPLADGRVAFVPVLGEAT